VEYDTPSTVTHYYTTEGEVQWHSAMADGTEDGGLIMTQWTPYTHYEPGAYAQTWNQAVFGPVLATPVHGLANKWVGVVRDSDTISVDLPLYSDAAGNIGFGGDSGGTTLYRDGIKVGQEQFGGEGTFGVPAGDAAYRLETHSERGTPYTLSTKIDATWTFRSQHVDGLAALPLWVVRFTPKLDDQHTAPAGGSAFTVPVTVTAQPGAPVGTVQKLIVEVSYNDGTSWTAATVQDGAVVLQHPRRAGSSHSAPRSPIPPATA
jgi:hypothetical protein